MLEKVISGGQTGADIGALKAAKKVGLATGGYMPRGFRTLEGFHPEYEQLYGMEELASADYPQRTRKNVQFSDATLRVARYWDSPGERCTLRAIRDMRKPFFDLIPDGRVKLAPVRDFLKEHRVKVLNVAGNSERTCPGIEYWVETCLEDFFKSLLETVEARY